MDYPDSTIYYPYSTMERQARTSSRVGRRRLALRLALFGTVLVRDMDVASLG